MDGPLVYKARLGMSNVPNPAGTGYFPCQETEKYQTAFGIGMS